MTLTYGFYDSSSSDRVYNAKQFGSIFDGIIEDGVYAGIGGKLMVIENSPTGMSVIVQSGRAWFDHTWTLNDANLVKTIAAADALLNRIDVVYLEVNEDSGTRANSINVLTGTPASTPVAPTLTQTSVIHQYPLAHVYVGAAVTVITQANITNKVGTTETPFVAGIIDYVTTNEIVAQWEAEWDQWFQDIIDQLSTEAETNLQNQIWDLAGVVSGAPPYATDMVTLNTHDHSSAPGNQIPSGGLAAQSVISGKIAPAAVQAGNIATGGVSAAAQLASDVVETAKIKDLAVSSSKLASNAVIAGKIADGAVNATAKLANDIVDDTKVGDRVAQVYRRQGGSSTDWSIVGSTTYSPGPVRIQCGAIQWTGSAASSGSKSLTFPTAFGYPPLKFIQAYSGTDAIIVTTVLGNSVPPENTGLQIFWETHDGSTVTSITFYWLAIGPE